MKKQNIAIIAVIALVLAVSVGYALFSQTLTIKGTATAKGNFDIKFTNVGTIVKEGYSDQSNSNGANIAVIQNSDNSVVNEKGGDTLNITVNKLDYPGAYVEIPVTITNNGTIPAKLKNIVETNLTDTNRAIKVTYSGVATSDAAIAGGQTKDMTVRVEWDKDVNESSENVEFSIQLEYEQITVATTAGS